MKLYRTLLSVILLVASLRPTRAQTYAPPPSRPPDAAQLGTLDERIARLGDRIASLRRQTCATRTWRMSRSTIRPPSGSCGTNKFARPRPALDIRRPRSGHAAAQQLAQGEAPWYQRAGQAVVHGYRSRIDGSVQPYAVTFPADYGKSRSKKWPIDVVLHTRDASLTEIKFLHQHAGEVKCQRSKLRAARHLRSRQQRLSLGGRDGFP